jgi:cytochrome c biogenesis protein CcmG/thiol:disulfide interchange protein DsbE
MHRLGFLALVVLAACPAPAPRPASPHLTAETVAPLAGGAPRSLTELHAGRPMVLDLYATWCKECRRQIAKLQQLASATGDKLVIVGVDVGDEMGIAQTFADRQHIGYPTFGDPDFRFADSMGVDVLPAILLIDAQGDVVHRADQLDDATRARIDELLR